MPQSRRERLKDKYAPIGETMSEERFESYVDDTIQRENRRLWALYRDLDVSQSEVMDLVNMEAEASQSTVSRVIRDHEDRILHDEDAVSIRQLPTEEDVSLYPEAWKEAYRDAVAEALVRVDALNRISSWEKQTPEYAAVRYPELVGCHREVAHNLGHEYRNAEIVDDNHLSGMDSVNIERWERRGISRADG